MVLLDLEKLSSVCSAWGQALQAEVGGKTLATVLSVAIPALAITLFKIWSNKNRPKVKILLADEMKNSRKLALEYCYRPRELMLKGYAQFRDEVFGIETRDGVKVVIPPQFLDALKSHPHLSFQASIDNDMQLQYTYFGAPPEYVIHAIKGNMNASLRKFIPTFMPVLHQMTQKNLPTHLGQYKDWTPVKVHDRVLRLVGTNNARVFQGTAASLDDEWVTASTGYVLSVFDCIKAIKKWHPMLRPFAYRFLPERTAINDQWVKGRKRVVASIRERQQKGGNLEDPPSMLDHLSSGKNDYLASDVEKQLKYQMTLVAVGTVTTFASITQALYDLASYPEYIPILREEVESCVRDHDGYFTKDSIGQMKKLDSFVKESQRLSAPDLTTFQRAATADMSLPDGTFIPKGTKLEVNTCSIHVDEEQYENPLKFDGLRYYRMRQEPGEENKHMYYSVGKNDLSFGYGRHACPGRYLGHVNIKLIMSEILLNYDLKLPKGAQRPANDEFEAIVSPDPEFELLLKSRDSKRYNQSANPVARN